MNHMAWPGNLESARKNQCSLKPRERIGAALKVTMVLTQSKILLYIAVSSSVEMQMLMLIDSPSPDAAPLHGFTLQFMSPEDHEVIVFHM